MDESILVDSISFGLPESEALHPAEGSFARQNVPVQNRYAGAAYTYAHDGPVHHWRDWAGTVALHLEVPPEYAESPLRLAIAMRSWIVGSPPREPEPTAIAIEVNGTAADSDKVLFAPDEGWIVVEADLPATQSGATRKIRVVLDDEANVFEDGSHYGKSISYLRLYALNPDGEPAP